MNHHTQGSCGYVFIFLAQIPMSGTPELWDGYTLNFIRNYQPISTVFLLFHIIHPPCVSDPDVIRPCQNLVLYFFYFSHFLGCLELSHCSSNFHFPHD